MFAGCISLVNITIPAEINTIGRGVFSGCTSLANVTMPKTVTRIEDYAFRNCTSLERITIPELTTWLGYYVFDNCHRLTRVYFQGDAPTLGYGTFLSADNATLFYFGWTKGWGPTFGGRPTVLWDSEILGSDASFGVSTNRFGFRIATSRPIIHIEACADLAHPVWSTVGTNRPKSGFSYFSDPQWTNSPTRFYRLRSP